MPHFKPFFYIDEYLDFTDMKKKWKRIFVQPNPEGKGVTIEILQSGGETVEFFMSPDKFHKFADKCIEASLAIDPDEQDWVGEAI